MLFKFGILLALVLLQVSIGVSYKFAVNEKGKYDFQPAALLVSSEAFKCILAFLQHILALRLTKKTTTAVAVASASATAAKGKGDNEAEEEEENEGEDAEKNAPLPTSSFLPLREGEDDDHDSSSAANSDLAALFAQGIQDVKAAASLKFCASISVLALMYCINNNLTFAIFALADPATFQLVKSMVPAVTAVLWANCMNKHVSETQWAAILLQVVGLCMMQYDSCKNAALSPFLAYVLLCISVLITSTSGVFNEFMVKKLPVGLGVQNFYLYLFGAIFNTIAYIFVVPASEKSSEWWKLLEGVHDWGIVILVCNCLIGLVVTAVYKYADVNLKNFASSGTSAVLLLISVIFLHMKPTMTLILGIAVVFLSAHVYFVDTVRTQPVLEKLKQRDREEEDGVGGRRNNKDGDEMPQQNRTKKMIAAFCCLLLIFGGGVSFYLFVYRANHRDVPSRQSAISLFSPTMDEWKSLSSSSSSSLRVVTATKTLPVQLEIMVPTLDPIFVTASISNASRQVVSWRDTKSSPRAITPVLLGTVTAPVLNGVATFTDLAIWPGNLNAILKFSAAGFKDLVLPPIFINAQATQLRNVVRKRPASSLSSTVASKGGRRSGEEEGGSSSSSSSSSGSSSSSSSSSSPSSSSAPSLENEEQEFQSQLQRSINQLTELEDVRDEDVGGDGSPTAEENDVWSIQRMSRLFYELDSAVVVKLHDLECVDSDGIPDRRQFNFSAKLICSSTIAKLEEALEAQDAQRDSMWENLSPYFTVQDEETANGRNGAAAEGSQSANNNNNNGQSADGSSSSSGSSSTNTGTVGHVGGSGNYRRPTELKTILTRIPRAQVPFSYASRDDDVVALSHGHQNGISLKTIRRQEIQKLRRSSTRTANTLTAAAAALFSLSDTVDVRRRSEDSDLAAAAAAERITYTLPIFTLETPCMGNIVVLAHANPSGKNPLSVKIPVSNCKESYRAVLNQNLHSFPWDSISTSIWQAPIVGQDQQQQQQQVDQQSPAILKDTSIVAKACEAVTPFTVSVQACHQFLLTPKTFSLYVFRDLGDEVGKSTQDSSLNVQLVGNTSVPAECTSSSSSVSSEHTLIQDEICTARFDDIALALYHQEVGGNAPVNSVQSSVRVQLLLTLSHYTEEDEVESEGGKNEDGSENPFSHTWRFFAQVFNPADMDREMCEGKLGSHFQLEEIVYSNNNPAASGNTNNNGQQQQHQLLQRPRRSIQLVDPDPRTTWVRVPHTFSVQFSGDSHDTTTGGVLFSLKKRFLGNFENDSEGKISAIRRRRIFARYQQEQQQQQQQQQQETGVFGGGGGNGGQLDDSEIDKNSEEYKVAVAAAEQFPWEEVQADAGSSLQDIVVYSGDSVDVPITFEERGWYVVELTARPRFPGGSGDNQQQQQQQQQQPQQQLRHQQNRMLKNETLVFIHGQITFLVVTHMDSNCLCPQLSDHIDGIHRMYEGVKPFPMIAVVGNNMVEHVYLQWVARTKDVFVVYRNVEEDGGYGFELGGIRAFLKQEKKAADVYVFTQGTARLRRPIPVPLACHMLNFMNFGYSFDSEIQKVTVFHAVFQGDLQRPNDQPPPCGVFGPNFVMSREVAVAMRDRVLDNYLVYDKMIAQGEERLMGEVANAFGCNMCEHTLDGGCFGYPNGFSNGAATQPDSVLGDRYLSKWWGTSSGGCWEMNECLYDPCKVGFSCLDNPGSFECIDTDECAVGSHNCARNGIGVCTNTPGSFSCSCIHGYASSTQLDENKMEVPTCTDMDECALQTHNCFFDPASGGECVNSVGSFACSCHLGYSPNFELGADQRVHCVDTNECALGTHNCAPIGGLCINNEASFTCSCAAGYQQSSSPPPQQQSNGNVSPANVCEDVDECSSANHLHNCPPDLSSCINTVGSFSCQCRAGYFLIQNEENSPQCSDMDECVTNLHNCPPGNGMCFNTIGSFFCSCATGFEIQNPAAGSTEAPVCNDIDECSRGSHNCAMSASPSSPSRIASSCKNTLGSFMCECVAAGYETALSPDDQQHFYCQDIDECALSRHNCAPQFGICTNNVGSFTCSCVVGYTMNPATMDCSDVDECTAQLHNCDTTPSPSSPSATMACQNVPGSFTCSCSAGYASIINLGDNKFHCEEVNECAQGTHTCGGAVCTNTPGSFTCSCAVGMEEASSSPFSCRDIDECGKGTHTCGGAVCTNTPGSFTCSCAVGMEEASSSPFSCRDIDECGKGTHTCGTEVSGGICTNTVGSFSCSCKTPEFEQVDPATFPDHHFECRPKKA